MKILTLISVLFLTTHILAQDIKPLKDYSFSAVVENDEVNYLIIEGCVSLFSAVTELTKDEYPDLASNFFEIANTIYPYGIISLSKIKNIPYENAEKKFFEKIKYLSEQYIKMMNDNGKKTGSFLKGSFLGEDLRYCYDVTSSLQLLISESLKENN